MTYIHAERLHDHSMTLCANADCDLPDINDMAVDNDVVHDAEYVLRLLLARMELSTYSTAFSGVDSPGTAFAQLRVSLCNMLGMPINKLHHPVHINAVVS